MSLRAKLYCGFFAVIFLAMVIGVLAIVAFRTTSANVATTNILVNEAVEQVIPASTQLTRLSTSMEAVGGNYYAYMMGRLEADFRDGNTHLLNAQNAINGIQKILENTDPASMPTTRKNYSVMLNGSDRLGEITNTLYSLTQELLSAREAIEREVDVIDESITATMAETKGLLGEAIENDEKAAAHRRATFLSVMSDLMAMLDGGRILFWQAQSVRGEESTALYNEQLGILRDFLTQTRSYNTPANIADPRVRGIFLNIQRATESYYSNIERMRELDMNISSVVKEMLTTYKGVNEAVRTTSNAAEHALVSMNNSILAGMGEIWDTVSKYSYIIIAVAMASLVLGLVISTLLIRNITIPITAIISSLMSGSEQINTASSQIAAASQDLADGATTQASSLEETSSAIEEMAAVTRQNAGNAHSTYDTTISNNKMVEQGVKAMAEMSAAMTDINDKSEQVSHIVKTIEDIAFQTNLLALNAAVEAARAGEAGKGFAVVADEVRNLSQRSAQAAKDTTELIIGTVESVKNGSEIVSHLTENFTKIEEGSGSVARLIKEIASATTEQAQGVEQVNTAVAQMDKITQQNAANSEQTATAADSLNSQAESLVLAVEDLVTLVSGKKKSDGSHARESIVVKPRQATSFSTMRQVQLNGPEKANQSKVAKIDSSTLIPLGDDF